MSDTRQVKRREAKLRGEESRKSREAKRELRSKE
jgi:hypothetical protein